MGDPLIRTRMLIGDDPIERLKQSKIAIFGVGGVGGYCAESLARSGIGSIDLYDDDTVSESNLNRQIAALHSTIGLPKAEVMASRIRDINPACQVQAIRMFYLPENAETVPFHQYDYVIDCIDTVTAKLDLIQRCTQQKIPMISAMGSGNKLDPSAFVVTDISKTEGCPLARIIRKELRKRGIQHLKVVYSTELPRSPLQPAQAESPSGTDTRPGSTARKDTPGSISFVPASAGLLLASAVVRDLGGF